jgi:hypothetical protein
MAAPTTAAGVKKALANPEPSTHGPTTGMHYDAHNKPHYLRTFCVRHLLRICPLYHGVFFVAPLILLCGGRRSAAW